MNTLWDERYDTDEFVYGREPNTFFAENLAQISPGKILLPGEGEGRNAIYAAGLNWKVDAFDLSSVGARKARSFALERGLKINYQVSDIVDYSFKKNYYDSAAFIYLHLPPPLRKLAHQKVMEALKPGGTLILEAFHTSQLGRKSGGPQSPEMLFDKEIILGDFPGLETGLLEETELTLEEGMYHGGAAKLIRYRGVKK